MTAFAKEVHDDGYLFENCKHEHYYDTFYYEAFTREDSDPIALADRVTTASDGLPCYNYRRNVTNCPLSSYTLFPQELAFSYLADFTRWDIVEEGTFLGRDCIIIEGKQKKMIEVTAVDFGIHSIYQEMLTNTSLDGYLIK